MKLIEARDLRKTYPNMEKPVLWDTNFTLAAGEAAVLLGVSGSGKSTLLQLLGLLDRPDSGSILFAGRETVSLRPDDRAKIRLSQIGFVFQFHHLIPELNVLENVGLPAAIAGRNEKVRALELLKAVGLDDKRSAYPWQLSGGESQRVALARALINRPKVVFTDEATGNLDGDRASQIVDLLLALSREEGTAVLSVTHDEGLSARYTSRYRLKDGQIWSEKAK